MYEYFWELDNLEDFKTYLLRESYDKNQDFSTKGIPFSTSLLSELSPLFIKLNQIDYLMMALKESLLFKSMEYSLLPYECLLGNGQFFQNRDESYAEMHDDFKKSLKFSSWDLECLLHEILFSIPYLVDFYPDYKDFLSHTQKEIQEALTTLKEKSTIKLPPKKDGKTVTWPNAWYITPNGYLYNTGFGHQRGNLIFSLQDISNCLKNNERVPNIPYHTHIQEIKTRGYITYDEFENYSHLIYKLPTILTPEVEKEQERYKAMVKRKEEYEKFITSSRIKWPHPERSYQKNLITLITGHLAAEASLYSAFRRINESHQKKEILSELIHLTNGDIRDILVRFCGFHKIESTMDKTITTSSLNGITEFSNYLKKGWNLYIIPGIVYDQHEDSLSEADFNSYFIAKHIDQELANYEGKGKILVKR